MWVFGEQGGWSWKVWGWYREVKWSSLQLENCGSGGDGLCRQLRCPRKHHLKMFYSRPTCDTGWGLGQRCGCLSLVFCVTSAYDPIKMLYFMNGKLTSERWWGLFKVIEQQEKSIRKENPSGPWESKVVVYVIKKTREWGEKKKMMIRLPG